ncbi:zinc-ribbon domain-containing protein [Oribacterium sp. KHPX15]|uniref:zinc-ribbon domain-containing protein n=1 Tax=Oribacterium sp. KHPX15 TaxID=1855342 RepID=UPI00089AAA86|nr:zinc-ribbon domain-containing protein [Oribacterium sp. KHPX15]SEA84963.1 zinc-ribbon domain-containing protein [Oribacterium sp. KHPX15]
MICRNCNNEISDTSAFCPNCGMLFVVSSPESSPEIRHNDNLPFYSAELFRKMIQKENAQKEAEGSDDVQGGALSAEESADDQLDKMYARALQLEREQQAAKRRKEAEERAKLADEIARKEAEEEIKKRMAENERHDREVAEELARKNVIDEEDPVEEELKEGSAEEIAEDKTSDDEISGAETSDTEISNAEISEDVEVDGIGEEAPETGEADEIGEAEAAEIEKDNTESESEEEAIEIEKDNTESEGGASETEQNNTEAEAAFGNVSEEASEKTVVPETEEAYDPTLHSVDDSDDYIFGDEEVEEPEVEEPVVSDTEEPAEEVEEEPAEENSETEEKSDVADIEETQDSDTSDTEETEDTEKTETVESETEAEAVVSEEITEDTDISAESEITEENKTEEPLENEAETVEPETAEDKPETEVVTEETVIADAVDDKSKAEVEHSEDVIDITDTAQIAAEWKPVPEMAPESVESKEESVVVEAQQQTEEVLETEKPSGSEPTDNVETTEAEPVEILEAVEAEKESQVVVESETETNNKTENLSEQLKQNKYQKKQKKSKSKKKNRKSKREDKVSEQLTEKQGAVSGLKTAEKANVPEPETDSGEAAEPEQKKEKPGKVVSESKKTASESEKTVTGPEISSKAKLAAGAAAAIVVLSLIGYNAWNNKPENRAVKILKDAENAYSSGDFEKAEGLYSQYMELGDAETETLIHMADTYVNRNRHDEAVDMIKAALDAHPESEALQKAYNDLEPVISFSQAGGTYDSPISVSLSASGTCDIYYTLKTDDGAEDESKYYLPIILEENGTYEVEAYGQTADGYKGASVTETFVVEIAPEEEETEESVEETVEETAEETENAEFSFAKEYESYPDTLVEILPANRRDMGDYSVFEAQVYHDHNKDVPVGESRTETIKISNKAWLHYKDFNPNEIRVIDAYVFLKYIGILNARTDENGIVTDFDFYLGRQR